MVQERRNVMKRTLQYFVIISALLLPVAASAEVYGVYIAPKFLLGIQDSGTISKSNTDLPFEQFSQATFGGALAVGYNFAPKFNIPIRAEIEYALRSGGNNEKSRGYMNLGLPAEDKSKYYSNISTLFFNAYFDIDTGTAFTPYVGGGLGVSFNYTDVTGRVTVPGAVITSGQSQYDTCFAWNVGAGVAYTFTENIAADVGYRFIGAGYREVGFGDAKIESSPYINEFYAGLRLTF